MQLGVTVQCCAMWAAGGGVGAVGKARGYLCRCLKCAAKSHICTNVGNAFKLGLGWAGGEYASAGKRDNFDKGEEEDDAAHNFKRSDHVLPIEIIFVISSTSSACIRVLLLG